MMKDICSRIAISQQLGSPKNDSSRLNFGMSSQCLTLKFL